MFINTVWNQAKPPHNAPLTGSLTTHGGRLLMMFSGSAFSKTAPAPVSVTLEVDGSPLTTVSAFANEANTHKSLVNAGFVANIPAGQHRIAVKPTTPSTVVDFNDVFTLTVLEMNEN